MSSNSFICYSYPSFGLRSVQDLKARRSAIFVLHLALVAITKFEGYQASDFMAFQLVMLALVATGLLLGAMVTERRETEEHLREQRAAPVTNVPICHGWNNGCFVGPPNKSAIVDCRNLLACCAPPIPIGSTPDPAAIADALDKAQAEARRAREVLERLKDFLSAWQDGT